MRTRGQRRILIGAAVGLIAAIAFLLRPAAGTRTAVGSTVARTAATPPPSTPSPPAATPASGGGSAPGLDALAPDALVASAAAEYRRRARYPRSSRPLDDGPDPLERDREVTRVTQHGQSGEDPALTVYPRATGFEDPEPAVLHAYLTNGKRRIRARTIRGTVTTEDLQPIGEIAYRDDGTGGDAVANDRVYTAVFLPSPEDAPTLSRSYLVQVAATARGGEERRSATSFLYSRPHAHLTGNFRDAVVNGNLEVGVEVEVATAGRFHVEATLYGADGMKKIAWAQAARALEPGRQWLPLQFYGLILRERDLAGPYLVRWVALSTTTAMPNAKNRLHEAGYRTASYDPARFTDRAFDDPDLVDAAARAETEH